MDQVKKQEETKVIKGQRGGDFSGWNKFKSYQLAKESGIEFAILKVINAKNKPDKLFYEHVSGCRSVGIPIIAGYTYAYANTEDKAKKASDAFVSVGAPKNIGTMVLDLEDKSMMGLGSKIIPIINIYRESAAAAGMDFLIYTGAQFYNPCLKPYAKDLADIPVWWARYPLAKEYTPTAMVPDAKFLPSGINLCGWQYTSQGVIEGVNGYADLNVWYRDEIVTNTEYETTAQYNPFKEPEGNVGLGKAGSDANWVLWYLWRFGKLVNGKGEPDSGQINGVILADTAEKIKEVQALLGLQADGVVGRITRSVWKRLA